METWEAAQGWFPSARMAPARQLYHASADALAEAIDVAWETTRAVMIFGHNPGLHELALTLMVSPRSRVEKALADSFPTGAAAVSAGMGASGTGLKTRPGLAMRQAGLPRQVASRGSSVKECRS